jgi:hypothetical protein
MDDIVERNDGMFTAKGPHVPYSRRQVLQNDGKHEHPWEALSNVRALIREMRSHIHG